MQKTNNKSIKVLLIEDNPIDAHLVQEMLTYAEGAPCALEHADLLSTGLERLAMGDIDVVLLDLVLPDSQGFDTFARAYAQAPQVPIIVLSSLDDEAMKVKAVQEGAQDYLVKGYVDGNLLVRAMRYAIQRNQVKERAARVGLIGAVSKQHLGNGAQENLGIEPQRPVFDVINIEQDLLVEAEQAAATDLP